MRRGLSLAAFLLFFSAHVLADPLFITGSESGDSSELANHNGAWSITTSNVRSGTYTLKINPVGTGTAYVEIRANGAGGANSASAPNAPLAWARTYIKIGTAPSADSEEILVFRNTGNTADKLSVRLNSARKLLVYNSALTLIATGTQVLASNTHYRVTAKSSNGTSGAWVVNLYNDPRTGNGSGAPTQLETMSGTTNQGATNVGMFRVGKVTDRNGRSMTLYFDDIYFDSTTEPGPGRNLRLDPDGPGFSAQWTFGTPPSDYTQANETLSDGDTTYVSNDGSANQFQQFGFEDTAAVGIDPDSIINAVGIQVRVRAEVSGTTSFFTGMESGSGSGPVFVASGSGLNTSYASRSYFSAVIPATLDPWSIAELDILQGTVKEVNAITDHLTSMYAVVDFEPPALTPTATPTSTPVPPTATPTNTPTATATNTPVPPTATPTSVPTDTPVPPTATPTPIPPTPTAAPTPGVGKMLLRERREG